MLIKKHGKRRGQIFADSVKCIDTEDLFIQGEEDTRSYGAIQVYRVDSDARPPQPCNSVPRFDF